MLKKLTLCYVSSLLASVKIVAASQHKPKRKKSLSKLVDIIENTDPDLKVHALHYANELLQNFCKLAKQTETIRNSQNRLWLWLNIVWKTLKLTRYQSKEISFTTFIYRSKAKAYAFNVQADIIHSQCEIEVLFSTLKNSPFPLVQSISLHLRALDLIPCLIPCHRCEKSTREPRHSHHLIMQRNDIHARATNMCVDPRVYMYMTPGWRNLF